MPTQQCGNCRFYAAYVDNTSRGVCRRHPPVGTLGNINRFPETWPTEWCGEYERAIPPAETPTG